MQPDPDPIVSEWQWFHVIADFLTDRGSDQNLADALTRSGIAMTSQVTELRGLEVAQEWRGSA
jgi:hypothetical protein